MPEIQIRPASAMDIPQLTTLEHGYTSDYVWQIDLQTDESQVQVIFRQTRLPRSVRVEYPHKASKISEDWHKRDGLFVGLLDDQAVGYISLRTDIAPSTAWIDDVVVMRRVRQQGIGTALILAGEKWAAHHAFHRLILEMQSKNYPAICLAQKLGFDFSGFHERYFGNMDIALFFSKVIG